jgi:TATA-binding protein-associated factor
VDDVGAVAASALIPVAARIVSDLPDQVEVTVHRLWDLLLEQDELAAACNSFMGLLAALLSSPLIHQHMRYLKLMTDLIAITQIIDIWT